MSIEDYTAGGSTNFSALYIALYGSLPIGSQIFLKVCKVSILPISLFPTQISFIVT